MRIRYYVHCFDGFDPTDTYRLLRVAHLLDAEESEINAFNRYLLSALHTDFPDYDPTLVESVLEQIDKIEQGKVEEYEYEGQGFTQYITRDRVRFEHSVFGECPEWPIWYCTLAQYKAALEGYRRFLDMPKSIDSELIVELPEGEPDVAER